MRFVSADDIDAVLTFPELIDTLTEAFVASGANPPRHHHAIGSGDPHATHLIMPAWTTGAPGEGQFLGTKLVNVFPGNGALGLPAVLGTYVLQSGQTGQPLAILDGTRLTHWRTAAASGLAARYLAAPDAAALTMVGAGALAPFLVRAHAAVRSIRRVTVWNHRAAGAERLAADLRRGGFDATASSNLQAAVAEADIVSCATLSGVPLVEGRWLKAGSHLDLVGAFNLAMREADDEALRLCRIYVDTPAALEEGGEVALGLRSGIITSSDVVADLHDLARGVATGRRTADERTLFKSVGASLEDLAAAILVWQRLARE